MSLVAPKTSMVADTLTFHTAHQARVRQNEEAMAEARGELWTIQIAYHPEHATAQIMHGRTTDQQIEDFKGANTSAHMFLDATTIIGDRLHVRQQACKLADTDNLFIYVIGGEDESARIETPELPVRETADV